MSEIVFPLASAFPVTPIGATFPDRWLADLADLVNVGASLLESRDHFPTGAVSRAVVLATLTRRALVTVEAIRRLAYYGLSEPAFAAMRTLLELELRARYVTHDAGDRAALQLVAFSYKRARDTAQGMLDDSDTRSSLKTDGAWDDVLAARRGAAEALADIQFDGVRDAVERQRGWYAEKDLLRACRAMGVSISYTQLYGPASEYTHGDSPDRDIARRPDGTAQLLPLASHDNERLGRLLLAATLRLYPILLMLVTGQPGLEGSSAAWDQARSSSAQREAMQITRAFEQSLNTFVRTGLILGLEAYQSKPEKPRAV